MIQIIEKEKHNKRTDPFWLESYNHFSFGDFYSPTKMNFGMLRAMNDDYIKSGYGFDAHPHQNIEMLSYVYNGTLTHLDNLNNVVSLPTGSLQYISAGKGMLHSERNLNDDPLRVLNFWIIPEETNTTPTYQSIFVDPNRRKNKIFKMISQDDDALINIKQDVNMFVCDSDKNHEYVFKVEKNRQVYLVCLKGGILINDQLLKEHDAAKVLDEDLNITTLETSTFIILEMHQMIDYRELNKFAN